MSNTSLPNLFILGAAKAGTTSLYEILAQHPQVQFPFLKETLFFSSDAYYQKGLQWYAKTFFDEKTPRPVRGDATPHYLYWAEKTAPRLHAFAERQPFKMVVIFRDPVQRAYSWYWNMVKEGKEPLTFEEALAQEDHRLQAHWQTLSQSGAMTYGYYRGGCYATQLQHFLSRFERAQFYFLLQEDLKNLQSEVFAGLIDFLQLSPGFPFQATTANIAALPRNQQAHQLVHGASSFKDLLKKIIPIRWRYKLKSAFTAKNMQPFNYPPISQSSARTLRQKYLPEIDQLETILQRDLSHWKITTPMEKP
jgi:hypothetical protein